jgi:ketosteroid isomerase-like protein
MRAIENPGAEEEQVLKANEAFYRALQSKDWKKLETVWLHEDWVQFLHHDMPRASGWKDVVSAFVLLFRGTMHLNVSFGAPDVRVVGDAAWVTLSEEVTMDVEGGFITMRSQTTNIFARRNGQWKMVHRHSSQVGDTQMAEVSRSVQ